MRHLKKCVESLAHYFLNFRNDLENGDSAVIVTYYLCLYVIPLFICASLGFLIGALLQLLNPITSCTFLGLFCGIVIIWRFNLFMEREEILMDYDSNDYCTLDEEEDIDIIED